MRPPRGTLPLIGTHTWANAYGTWFVIVMLREPVTPTWLATHMERLRVVARQALVSEISTREGKTWETYLEAAERVDETLGPVVYHGTRFVEGRRFQAVEFRELSQGENPEEVEASAR